MMTLSVGIVMRTKNRVVLLKRALESVLNQSYPHWKLVVVNDGGETEMVDKLLAHHQEKWQGRMQVIHNSQSVGMEAASNLGLRELHTDLAVIHDDDDSWSPDFLLRMTQTYAQQKQQFPNIGGVACHMNHVLESIEGNIVRIEKSEDFNQWLNIGFIPLKQMLRQNCIGTMSFVYELAVCKELGGYDEALPVLGDWDFNLRFMRKKDIWVLPETLAFYHHRLTATGSLGNSVIEGEKKHHLYRVYLENKWLREDLQLGQLGMGAMVTLSALRQS